jgi:hypothetical protein
MGGTLWAMLVGYAARMVPAERRGRRVRSPAVSCWGTWAPARCPGAALPPVAVALGTVALGRRPAFPAARRRP